MKYLLFWSDRNGKLHFDVFDTKEEVYNHIRFNFSEDILIELALSNELNTFFKVVEIEPNYDVLKLETFVKVDMRLK